MPIGLSRRRELDIAHSGIVVAPRDVVGRPLILASMHIRPGRASGHAMNALVIRAREMRILARPVQAAAPPRFRAQQVFRQHHARKMTGRESATA